MPPPRFHRHSQRTKVPELAEGALPLLTGFRRQLEPAPDLFRGNAWLKLCKVKELIDGEVLSKRE